VLCNSIDPTQCIDDDDSPDYAVMSAAAEKLLPALFRIVTSASDKAAADVEDESRSTVQLNQQLPGIEKGIAGLVRYAPSEFVQGLFKKLMHRLLEELQNDKVNDEKVCSFLTLAQALVTSKALNDDSISFLYRALKPTLNEKGAASRRQKRAYKVLATICQSHHSYFMELEHLKDLVNLLAATVSTSQVAARSMRLKCMNIILDGFDETRADYMVSRSIMSIAIILGWLFVSNTNYRMS
jgi:ribosomal RNA-processing protein 12